MHLVLLAALELPQQPPPKHEWFSSVFLPYEALIHGRQILPLKNVTKYETWQEGYLEVTEPLSS